MNKKINDKPRRMRIKKGDTVVVISGQDKGKKGRVLKAFPKTQKLIIEKVNFIKKHSRPTQQNQKGGIIEKEAPIHVSNVQLFNEKLGEKTKPVMKKVGDSRVRVCKKTGDEI
jgi:large subunit ribosomal protein L24